MPLKHKIYEYTGVYFKMQLYVLNINRMQLYVLNINRMLVMDIFSYNYPPALRRRMGDAVFRACRKYLPSGVILILNFLFFFSGPPNPDSLPDDGKLKSETMVKDNRRYYLDLKENQRGRFLRV